jgi:hypothetical protein
MIVVGATPPVEGMEHGAQRTSQTYETGWRQIFNHSVLNNLSFDANQLATSDQE